MTRTHTSLLTALLLAAIALPACGPTHIAPFTPRTRSYTEGAYAQGAASAKPAPGSLFSDANPGYLEDTRAVRVGDVLVITINENANASGTATTDLSRNSSADVGMTNLLGIMPALTKAYPGLNPAELAQFASKTAFAGKGDTARNGQLTGNVAVRVVKEMPNGDLYLEGTKVVLINNEEYHLYVSGLVRPTDIAQDNSIVSTRIADAQIEFTGRGDIADQQKRGWFAKALDAVNPF